MIRLQLKEFTYFTPTGVAKCDLEVWRNENGACMILITELEDNPGMSITNAMEEVLKAISLALQGEQIVDIKGKPQWIIPLDLKDARIFEYYPYLDMPTLDLVNIHAGERISWSPFTRKKFEAELKQLKVDEE